MIDGIIALLICYFTRSWYQPYFDQYTQIKLSQGYQLANIQASLDLLELAIQITTFIVVYGIIRLIKYFFQKKF